MPQILDRVSFTSISFTFLMLLQFSTGRSSLEIVSTETNIVEYEGANVTLSCTVRGKGYDFFNNQIIWYKSVDGDEGDIQVNTGAVVSEPFYSTHRYSVEPTIFDSTAEISLALAISVIELSDSGAYRCVLYQKQQVLSAITHVLVIPAPVQQLTLTINTTTINNNNNNHAHHLHNKTVISFVAMTTNATSHGMVSYQVEEQDRTSVECLARGTGQIPELRLSLGGGPSAVDVTPQFHRLQTLTRRGPRGLDVVDYELRLVADDFRLDADDENKHLKCLARIHGHPELTRKAVGHINVRYAPKFVCSKERTAALGSRLYRLECVVRANPPVAVDDVIWQIGDVNATNMTSGDVYDVFSASAEVDTKRGHELNVALTIDEITEPSYRVYGLVASNVLGERYYHLILRQAAAKRQTSIRTDTVSRSGDDEHSGAIQVDSCWKITASIVIFLALHDFHKL